jgi:hypothetical protein
MLPRPVYPPSEYVELVTAVGGTRVTAGRVEAADCAHPAGPLRTHTQSKRHPARGLNPAPPPWLARRQMNLIHPVELAVGVMQPLNPAC